MAIFDWGPNYPSDESSKEWEAWHAEQEALGLENCYTPIESDDEDDDD